MLAIRCHGQFTFSGNADRDCSVWDRIFTLTVDCGAGEVELGRWINAFQRRVGHWLTTVPLLPLLYPAAASGGGGGGGGVCNVTVADNGDPWLATLNIRFGAAQSADEKQAAFGQPSSVVPLVYPNPSQGFSGPAYNQNRTVPFSVAAGTTRVAVAAIISGHGGCEFQPTSHHWVMNSRADYNTSAPEYADRFMEAGTALGCADKTARGMVPNEHGTWYFGRNGNTGRLPFVLPGMGFACPLAGHPLAV